MISDFNKFHFCLNCSSVYSENEYNFLEFKSRLFSLGYKGAKCSHCKSRGAFVDVTETWAEILRILNAKGYSVTDCSLIDELDNKLFTYIRFKYPISPNIKPKCMSYISKWSSEANNILLREDENQHVIRHEYLDTKNIDLEFEKLTKNLFKWAKSIPIKV